MVVMCAFWICTFWVILLLLVSSALSSPLFLTQFVVGKCGRLCIVYFVLGFILQGTSACSMNASDLPFPDKICLNETLNTIEQDIPVLNVQTQALMDGYWEIYIASCTTENDLNIEEITGIESKLLILSVKDQSLFRLDSHSHMNQDTMMPDEILIELDDMNQEFTRNRTDQWERIGTWNIGEIVSFHLAGVTIEANRPMQEGVFTVLDWSIQRIQNQNRVIMMQGVFNLLWADEIHQLPFQMQWVDL